MSGRLQHRTRKEPVPKTIGNTSSLPSGGGWHRPGKVAGVSAGSVGISLLGGLVLVLVSLELALQLASLAAWLWLGHDDATRARSPDERVILCVGDSFTYGIGASTPAFAYPPQLAAQLRMRAPRDGSWVVLNRGWPGRNSAELVQRMPALLATVRPDYVTILIGTNDAWSDADATLALPPLVPPPGGAASASRPTREWVWRWRTRRLVQLLMAKLAGWSPGRADDGSVGAPPPAVGTNDPRSNRGPPAGTHELPPDGRLIVDLNLAWQRFEGDADATAFSTAMAELVPRALAASQPMPAVQAVKILGWAGRNADAVRVGEQAVAVFGDRASLCGALALPLARVGRLPEADAMAHRAIALSPDGPARAAGYRTLAQLQRISGEAVAALVSLVRAFALDGKAAALERGFREALPAPPLAAFEQALDATVDLAPATREEAVAIYRRVQTRNGQRERLERNLRQMVALVRAAGATPVLITYPWIAKTPHPILAAIRAVAATEHVDLVDLGPVFAERLKTVPRDALYRPDGHFTDLGYSLVADAVATSIIDLDAIHPGAAAVHGGN
jgi:lysophospholipase L1-like esterase